MYSCLCYVTMFHKRAYDKTVPLISRLSQPLRMALQAKEPGVFSAALEAIQYVSVCANIALMQCFDRHLSNTVGPALNSQLNILLVQIHKKMFDKSVAEQILKTLETLERNGGPVCECFNMFYLCSLSIPASITTDQSESPYVHVMLLACLQMYIVCCVLEFACSGQYSHGCDQTQHLLSIVMNSA